MLNFGDRLLSLEASARKTVRVKVVEKQSESGFCDVGGAVARAMRAKIDECAMCGCVKKC